jgi:hypothetical protein
LTDSLLARLVIITSRHSLGRKTSRSISLYPQPLGAESLLRLMIVLLDRAGQEGQEIRSSVDLQLELAKRLNSANTIAGQPVLTPLVVQLFVNKAIQLLKRGEQLRELPSSAAEAYVDYVREMVNRASRAVTSHDLVRFVGYLARQAVGGDFIPRAISSKLILQDERFPNAEKMISILCEVGLLSTTIIGLENQLKFLLDPVAEYSGAFFWAEECGSNPDRWKALWEEVQGKLPGADGFQRALQAVSQAYGPTLHWPRINPVEE